MNLVVSVRLAVECVVRVCCTWDRGRVAGLGRLRSSPNSCMPRKESLTFLYFFCSIIVRIFG